MNKKYFFILFLLSPIITFIYAFKNKSIYTYYTGVAFITYAALTVIPQEGSDMYAFAEKIENYNEFWALNNFQNNLSFFFSELLSIEIVTKFLLLTSSIFTSTHFIYTGVIGLITGIVMMNVYKFLIGKYRNNQSDLLCLFLLLLSSPIWTINGRFWLGFWIFTYALLLYIHKPNLKRYLLFLLPITFHTGWGFIFLIITFFHLTKNFKKIYFLYLLLIGISFFIQSYANDIIIYLGGNVGGEAEEKSLTYAKHVVEKQTELGGQSTSESPFFITLRTNLVRWGALILFTLNIIKRPFSRLRNMELFLLLMLSFVIAFYYVPSLGGRVSLVWSYIVLIYIALEAYNRKLPYYYFRLILPILVVNTFYAIRIELVQTSLITYFGNPILFVIFGSDTVTTRDFLALFI